jgi:hypothetical protein
MLLDIVVLEYGTGDQDCPRILLGVSPALARKRLAGKVAPSPQRRQTDWVISRQSGYVAAP